jgi:hypothetical protein
LIGSVIINHDRGVCHIFRQIHIWLVVLTILKNMKGNGKDSPIYEMENKQCSKPPTRYFECVSQFMHTDLYLGTSQNNVLPACNPIILWQFNRAIRKTAILKLLKMGNFQLQYVKNHGIHRVPLVFRVMETSWKCPMSTAAGRPTLKNLEKNDVHQQYSCYIPPSMATCPNRINNTCATH